MLIPVGYAASPTQPHLQPNLLSNPGFNGLSNWILSYGAQYDAGVSRTSDGSGSVKLPPSGRIDSSVIPVTPGKTYTFAAYMRTAIWPPGHFALAYSVVGAGGNYIRYGGGSGPAGNSGPGKWEEIAMTVTPDTSTFYITLVIVRIYPDVAGSGDMWLDEVYFGEGVGFEQPPAPKTSFNGANVQVDELGNFSVLKSGTWQPFFPLCIYADGNRPNWSDYSNQGFNCNIRGSSGDIQRAKNAVSSFNPDGMMTGIDISGYVAPGWTIFNNGPALVSEINNIKSAGLMDHVLLYHWDNEVNWTEWNAPQAMTDVIKQNDRSPGGQRLHPIYVLQGSYNAARMYRDVNGVPITDVTGTYISGDNTSGAGSAGGLVVLQNIEGQTEPVTVAQMNIVWAGTGVGALRGNLYTYIAKGARGAGFWRDRYPTNPSYPDAIQVDQTDWWPDLPNVRREIDQMLPLIRQPHWTSWTAAYNASLPLAVGTRDYQGQGYLIVANNSSSAVTVTFTLTGLPYTPQNVIDYFTGNTVAAVSGNSFTVTLPALGLASGTAVYKIAGSATATPVITSPASAAGTVGSPFSYQITATNGPTSYNAAPLLAGLSVDTASGLISGTPTAAGTSSVTLSASNGVGTGTATLHVSFVIPSTGPIAWWKLDETSGTTASDASGNGNIGTLYNGSTVCANTAGCPTWVSGKIGGALSLEGAGDAVQISGLLGNPQSLTLAAWANLTAAGTAGAEVISLGDNTALRMDDPSVGAMGFYYDGAVWRVTFAPGLLAGTGWHHLAYTADGASHAQSLYVDGKPVATTNFTTPIGYASFGTNTFLGRHGNGDTHRDFKGWLDDVRVYNRALSASEVQTLFRFREQRNRKPG